MPGIKKSILAELIVDVLRRSGLDVEAEEYAKLPYNVTLTIPKLGQRSYRLYFWTVSHGGKTRDPSEFRIQTKLDASDRLEVGGATTLLLGYYLGTEDGLTPYSTGGSAARYDMNLFVAWDPIEHLKVGKSSSCQVRLSLMYRAHLIGASEGDRKTADGSREKVFAFRKEKLAKYFIAARAGHRNARLSDLI